MTQKLNPEDAFYENLTLGLMKVLSNVPRVTNVFCEKRQPCEKAQVMNWEQRHNVYLPEDMKKFYLSTDGFILYWSYQYSPNDIRRVGCIHFPHLLQITLLRENIEANSPRPTSALSSSNIPSIVPSINPNSSSNNPSETSLSNSASNKSITSNYTNGGSNNSGPVITSKTKIFELNSIYNLAKVCLVYELTGLGNPKIYLLELNTFKWQFLAETFSEYLRMAIAHLGLPYWELCFSSFGLPSWTEQLFLLLAPHLLEESEQRRGKTIQPITEQSYSQLDLNIFRAKPRGTKQNSKIKNAHSNNASNNSNVN